MVELRVLKNGFEEGKYDDLLSDIYVDKSRLEYQRGRYVAALSKFEELYGSKAVGIYSAPGRSEVGGNHTDHQRGQVLACAVNLDAIAVVAPREDGAIKIVSDSFNLEEMSVDTINEVLVANNDAVKTDIERNNSVDSAKTNSVAENGISSNSALLIKEGTSEALVLGVACKLLQDGYKIGGFEAFITSDVLIGAGLSSSAAFEVLIGTILSYLYNDGKLNPIYIAQAAQYAENVFFGKPCGLMDQMASSVGSLVNIDFGDKDNPIVNKVEVDFEEFKHSLCIIDTKGDHADLTAEYAAIPAEMKKVAAFFGKEVLREVKESDFYEHLNELREALGDRPVLRAMHFYYDHWMAGCETRALCERDFDHFKKCITDSGNSSYKYLQNVYPMSDIQAQSVAVGISLCEKLLLDHGVCRVHGGGFAGTVQAFVENDYVDSFKQGIEKFFGEDSCHVLKVRKYGGMEVIA